MFDLGAIFVTIGANTAPLQAAMSGAMRQAAAQGQAAGAQFGGGFMNRFGSAIGGGGGLVGRLGGLAGVAGLASGAFMALGGAVDFFSENAMKPAAELGRYRHYLQSISGDATTAGRAFNMLGDFATKTSYGFEDIFSLGIRFGGQSGDVMGGAQQAIDVANAAAMQGVRPEMFDLFRRNLEQNATRDRKLTIPDLEQAKRYAPLMVDQFAKFLGVTNEEATKRIRSMTGKEWTQMQIEMGRANPNAAANLGAMDPFTAMGNVKESMRWGLSASGGLANALLTPLITRGLDPMVDAFAQMNVATGGTGLFTTLSQMLSGPAGIAGVIGQFVGGGVLGKLFGGGGGAAGGVGSPQDRMAKAAEKTAENTATTAEILKYGKVASIGGGRGVSQGSLAVDYALARGALTGLG